MTVKDFVSTNKYCSVKIQVKDSDGDKLIGNYSLSTSNQLDAYQVISWEIHPYVANTIIIYV